MVWTDKKRKESLKESEEWKDKAEYWHNAIPMFNQNYRGSFTDDINMATNVRSLELNKKLYIGIQWNNWITILVSVLNLVLLIYNIIHLG